MSHYGLMKQRIVFLSIYLGRMRHLRMSQVSDEFQSEVYPVHWPITGLKGEQIHLDLVLYCQQYNYTVSSIRPDPGELVSIQVIGHLQDQRANKSTWILSYNVDSIGLDPGELESIQVIDHLRDETSYKSAWI